MRRPSRASSARRTRPNSSHANFVASTREILSDPILVDDPLDIVQPQSQLHSVDDAPPPVSHPPRTIFPDLNVNTDEDNVSTEEEQVYRKEVGVKGGRSDDDIGDDDALDVSFGPGHRSRRGTASGMQRKKRKGKPFAGVDSLLNNLSLKREPVRRSDSAAGECGDDTSPVVKRRRPSRALPAGESSPPVEIDEKRFEALMQLTSEAGEKIRFRRMFRSVSGRQHLFRMAESRMVSLDDDDSNSPPKRSRRLTRASSSDSAMTQQKSEGTDGSVEIGVEEMPSDEEASPKRTVKRRKAAEKQRSRRTPANNSSVPLPKLHSTLINRLNERAPFQQRQSARVTRSPKRMKKSRAAGKRAKNATNDRVKNTRVGTRRSNRRKFAEPVYDEDDEEVEELGSDYEEEVNSDGNGEEEEEEEVDSGEVVIDGGSEHESDGDEDFEIDESVSPRARNKRRSAEKSQRRKRTRPTNAFESRDAELSVQEQRERLDFLVKQSADIARELHIAMAEATSTQPTSTVKSPMRRGKATAESDAVEGDASTQDPSGKPDDADTSNTEVLVREEESFAPPNGVGRELQPHQTDGVKWLLALDAQGLNAILADEMGLGKTIQAVAFLASLVLSGSRGPHLIVAPKNVCEHWAAEVRAWYPGRINVVTHLGCMEERLEELEGILEEDNFDIIVTSYEIALRELFNKKRLEGGMTAYRRVLRRFRKVEFEYLVVDEAHRLKNDHSKVNQGIRQYNQAQRRLLLTGTPLSNKLKELWSLMNVLNPKIFSNKATFEAWFAAPFDCDKGARARLTHAEQSVIVDRLHTILRPFFRRRVRADVCPSFTSADEIVVRCPMSQLQKAMMLHFRRRADAREGHSANNLILSMRMVSSHPYTVSNALFAGDDNQVKLKLVSSSGKFAFLHYSLPRLFASGHRVLIFAQFRRTLDFLEDLMEMLGVKYGRLDGGTPSQDRLWTIAAFNAPESELKVFLLTTRAGGIGINLQTADTVILFDSDWNPSADLQAVSRIQRIGQKKTVHMMRLLTEMSADEQIYETTRRKLRTQAVAVGAGKFNTSSGAALDQNVRQKDLEQLLQELDINNFLPVGVSASLASMGGSQGTATVPPLPGQREARDAYVKEWDQALLRRGETSLGKVEHQSIWIDTPDENGLPRIPVWLGKDANLSAAGRALCGLDPTAADFIYEERLQSVMREGIYSKKDRAARARRKIIMDSESDFDNESENTDNDSADDPSAKVEELEEDLSSDSGSGPEPKLSTTAGTVQNEVDVDGGILNAGIAGKDLLISHMDSKHEVNHLGTAHCAFSSSNSSAAKRVTRNLPEKVFQYALSNKHPLPQAESKLPCAFQGALEPLCSQEVASIRSSDNVQQVRKRPHSTAFPTEEYSNVLTPTVPEQITSHGSAGFHGIASQNPTPLQQPLMPRNSNPTIEERCPSLLVTRSSAQVHTTCNLNTDTTSSDHLISQPHMESGKATLQRLLNRHGVYRVSIDREGVSGQGTQTIFRNKAGSENPPSQVLTQPKQSAVNTALARAGAPVRLTKLHRATASGFVSGKDPTSAASLYCKQPTTTMTSSHSKAPTETKIVPLPAAASEAVSPSEKPAFKASTESKQPLTAVASSGPEAPSQLKVVLLPSDVSGIFSASKDSSTKAPVEGKQQLRAIASSRTKAFSRSKVILPHTAGSKVIFDKDSSSDASTQCKERLNSTTTVDPRVSLRPEDTPIPINVSGAVHSKSQDQLLAPTDKLIKAWSRTRPSSRSNLEPGDLDEAKEEYLNISPSNARMERSYPKASSQCKQSLTRPALSELEVLPRSKDILLPAAASAAICPKSQGSAVSNIDEKALSRSSKQMLNAPSVSTASQQVPPQPSRNTLRDASISIKETQHPHKNIASYSTTLHLPHVSSQSTGNLVMRKQDLMPDPSRPPLIFSDQKCMSTPPCLGTKDRSTRKCASDSRNIMRKSQSKDSKAFTSSTDASKRASQNSKSPKLVEGLQQNRNPTRMEGAAEIHLPKPSLLKVGVTQGKDVFSTSAVRKAKSKQPNGLAKRIGPSKPRLPVPPTTDSALSGGSGFDCSATGKARMPGSQVTHPMKHGQRNFCTPSRPSALLPTADRKRAKSSVETIGLTETIDLTGDSDVEMDAGNKSFVPRRNVKLETSSSSEFTAMVDRLQEMTKVNDMDFLVNALLATRCNFDAAVKYVYTHIK